MKSRVHIVGRGLHRGPYLVLLGTCWAVFILAIVWPTFALIGRCVAQGEPPDGGFSFSSRQLWLLWRSVWLSTTATVLCLLVSLPGAYAVGRLRRLSHRPLVATLLILALLTPPMVYAFGWERILPVMFNPYARCALVWALWAWPIPAMLIGTGWSRVGSSIREAALLVASPPAAFLRVALPGLIPYIGFSALVVFVLCFRDYGVPHACGLLVYATELLGWARESTRVINIVWPSTLSVAVTGGVIIAMFFVWRSAAADALNNDADAPGAVPRNRSKNLTLIAVGCFVVSWLLPMGALVAKLASPEVIVEAARVYATDLAWSLGLAVLSGLVVVGMGLGVITTGRFRALGLGWAIAFGALPGALIGESLVAAYNHRTLWWIYDHWPIIALCYVSRFGWIGILTAKLAIESAAPNLIAQARIDGASRLSALGHIHLPTCWPTLLCGAGVVAAMSVADVATSSLVRVPAFGLISHILMEKFHRFEYGMLISLSLWLVAATLPPAVLLALALKLRRTT